MNQSGMTLRSLESSLFWWQIVGIALVLLSAFAGGFVLYFRGRVTSAKDAAFGGAIASANERASNADERAARALQETEQLRVEAGRLGVQTQSLKADVARQRERAAKAELALLEFQQRVAPRGLTGHARVSLINVLRTAAPGKVDFACMSSNGEGVQYMDEIASAMREAGWPIVGMIHNLGGPNPVGVLLLVRSIAEPPSHAATLLAALQAAGISPLVGPDGDVPVDTVRLWIGRKAQ